MSKFKKSCRGIINQLFDLAEVPVEKRQKINDKADAYLEKEIYRIVDEYFSTFNKIEINSSFKKSFPPEAPHDRKLKEGHEPPKPKGYEYF